MSNENNTNPFDDESYQFTVLRNGSGQYSLWPEFAPQPAGWQWQHGPAPRSNAWTTSSAIGSPSTHLRLTPEEAPWKHKTCR